LSQAVSTRLLTAKDLAKETCFCLTDPHRCVPLSLGLDQPLTDFAQLLLKVPDHLDQMLKLSLSAIMSMRVSRVEQFRRELNQNLTKVAATAGQLPTLSSCPERFLVQP
jgi:hypothetical protein